MTDDLDRIRSLRDEAPDPSDDWAHRTRAELLRMAAQEREREPVAAEPGPLARLRERLALLAASPRPVAVAGAAVLTLVAAGVAVPFMPPGAEEEPAGPMANGTTEEESGARTPPDHDGIVVASSCEGGDGAYTVRYPEGWHTDTGEASSGCERFDDEPIELEAQTGGAPEYPVAVQVLPVGFDVATDPGDAQREISRSETTVAGRDAVVAEWTSTGEAALPEGMRSYRYLIDLDGERTLMVAAYDLDDEAFDDYREVVDAMVDSLEVADG